MGIPKLMGEADILRVEHEVMVKADEWATPDHAEDYLWYMCGVLDTVTRMLEKTNGEE